MAIIHRAPKRTLVLGASMNPSRYSYLAIERLIDRGHEVLAVGRRPGTVLGVSINQDLLGLSDIHTVTLYLNYKAQESYMEAIINLRPKRIIFNPGAENPEFMERAREEGIEVMNACNLVMLSTNTF